MLSHLRAATQSLVDWKFLCKQITNRVLSLVLFFVCRFAQQQIPITSISELRSFCIISFVPCVSLSVTGYIWAFFSCTPASSLLLLSYVIRLRWTKSIQVRKPTKTTKKKRIATNRIANTKTPKNTAKANPHTMFLFLETTMVTATTTTTTTMRDDKETALGFQFSLRFNGVYSETICLVSGSNRIISIWK